MPPDPPRWLAPLRGALSCLGNHLGVATALSITSFDVYCSLRIFPHLIMGVCQGRDLDNVVSASKATATQPSAPAESNQPSSLECNVKNVERY